MKKETIEKTLSRFDIFYLDLHLLTLIAKTLTKFYTENYYSSSTTNYKVQNIDKDSRF